MRIVGIGIALALALPSAAEAQVDYDSVRRTREILVELIGGRPPFTWIDRQVEDSFTRETRQYVEGWGEQEVLFLVASCDAVSIVFGNRGPVFENGLVEAIWDDGGIMQYEAQDFDSRLVIADPDWMRRLRTHRELRIRVRVFQNSLASDVFDLTSARLSANLSESDSAVDVENVGELFRAVGCE